MKVSELIAKLQGFNPELPVLVTSGMGYEDIDGLFLQDDVVSGNDVEHEFEAVIVAMG